jgi:predicted Zn-dependent protease
MIRRIFAVCAVCAWSLSAAGQIDPDSIGKLFGGLKGLAGKISPEEERAFGREASATLLGAEPVLADPAAQRYVNRVGLWVALQTERPELAWRFAVLDDPDVNAFAAPGGYVFVTKGLLELLDSEAELAGVLSHEVTHVVRKHHLNALTKDKRMSALTGLASDKIGGNDPRKRELTAKVLTGVKTLYARGLDKADEFQADREGVVIAARAGYDASGLVGVVQKLDALDPGAAGVALLFKTHPLPADRLATLDDLFATGELDRLSGVEGRERYRSALRSILGTPAPAPKPKR